MNSLISHATSSSQEPISGHLYKLISEKTFESPENCRILEECLVRNLSKSKDGVVILKCLKILRHVCEDGDKSFRRRMATHSSVVRGFQSYKGKADPLVGDSLSRAIRYESDLCLKVIFNDSIKCERPIKLEGFGQEQSMCKSYSGGATTSSNTNLGIYLSSFSPAIVEPIKQIAENAYKYVPPTVKKQLDRFCIGMSTCQEVTNNVRNQQAPWAPRYNYDQERSVPAGESITAIEAEVETRIVEDFCQLGGARAIPPPSVIQDFVNRCGSLNMEIICSLLLNKLEVHQDQKTQRKALCALKSLLVDDKTSHELRRCIRADRMHALTNLREKSVFEQQVMEILSILGESDKLEGIEKTKTVRKNLSETADLIDIMDFNKTDVKTASDTNSTPLLHSENLGIPITEDLICLDSNSTDSKTNLDLFMNLRVK